MNTLILDAFRGQTRAMLLSPEGDPVEIRLAEAEEESCGAVYLAHVERISMRLRAAFVDIGAEKNAFLPLEKECTLKQGEYLPVQGVAVQENEDKGFRVRRNLQIPGRFLVYLPGAGKVRCSSRITDPEERARLMQLAEECLSGKEGAILRTGAQGASPEELRSEIEALRACAHRISERAKTELRPGLLWRPAAAERILSSFASQGIGVIVTNDADLADDLRTAAGERMPGAEVRYFREDRSLLCDAYGLDAAIRKTMQRKQWLPSGGTVIVDICEAMTVYDVNSGGSAKGSDPEEAALALNLEAARLIARHIRLTGIGGIIMIDFIDMRRKENRDAVLREMRTLVKEDPGSVEAYAIGPLGVMQLSRKRTGISLERALRAACRACGGRGTVPSAAWMEEDRARALRRAELSGAEQQGDGCRESGRSDGKNGYDPTGELWKEEEREN